jgi:hypothetical protein
MLSRVLAAIAILCLGGAANAANVAVWSAPGTSCVPADAAINAKRYRTGVASVQHATTNVDPIVLVCDMQPFGGAGSYNLKLTYQDSTGTGASGSVIARLYRLPIGSATPVQISAVNSNASAITGVNAIQAIFNQNFASEFNANVFFVRVELRRTSTAATVVFHSIVIEQILP